DYYCMIWHNNGLF
nr:immunoglobulin light chain junction region [Macaca mulatta]MOV94833.1 immunoglobulin light chain junction region [Macaca mulatta]MOV94945.1 immunoglobulin light chain junction region [Macaca mulatta]MOV96174.1 immunoglobulin light chain junction region [Macaca mulatta]MOV97161.1 immunoglobulin light chain junction region [Macaca mulatta]